MVKGMTAGAMVKDRPWAIAPMSPSTMTTPWAALQNGSDIYGIALGRVSGAVKCGGCCG